MKLATYQSRNTVCDPSLHKPSGGTMKAVYSYVYDQSSANITHKLQRTPLTHNYNMEMILNYELTYHVITLGSHLDHLIVAVAFLCADYFQNVPPSCPSQCKYYLQQLEEASLCLFWIRRLWVSQNGEVKS